MSYTSRLYIQKTSSSSPVKETIKDFDIYLKDLPFKPSSDAKELYSNNWFDEHGDDEYIPDELMMSAYQIDVEFAYKGDKDTAYAKIKSFLDYLTGADGTGVEMKMVSTYEGFGRQGIRYVSMADDAELFRDDNGDILIFKITFKVNDPVTNIVVNYKADGSIESLGE